MEPERGTAPGSGRAAPPEAVRLGGTRAKTESSGRRIGSVVPGSEPVRLDKWLWAARFFKTRALAARAIAGGRVEVNGARAAHAKTVRAGDALRVRLGPYEHLLTVRAVSQRRGPATEAAKLFEEDAAGRARRLHLLEQHRLAQHSFSYGEGKPSKKERRAILRFKRGE